MSYLTVLLPSPRMYIGSKPERWYFYNSRAADVCNPKIAIERK